MKKSRKILIGILICVIIGSVFYIGYYYVTQNKNEKVYKKTSERGCETGEQRGGTTDRGVTCGDPD